MISTPVKRLCMMSLVAACSYAHAEEPEVNYFDKPESLQYDHQDRKTFVPRRSNRFDSAPQLKIKRFDLQGVSKDDSRVGRDEILALVEAHREENNDLYTVDELHDLAEKITHYYRNKGLFLAQAFIPEQDIKDNTVIIRVLEGRLGQVRFSNLELFEEDTLTTPFESQLGKPINKEDVESSILLMSTYPGLTTSTLFSPGEKPGEADLVVKVEEEKHIEAKASFDNYGSEFTGKFRGQLEAQVNDLTNAADHLKLNLLLTISPANTVYGGLYYERPLGQEYSGTLTRFLNPFFGQGFSLGLGVNRNTFEVGQELAQLNITGSSQNISLHLKKSIWREVDTRLDSAVNIHLKNAETEQASALLGEDKLTVVEWDTNYLFNSSWLGEAVNEVRFTYNLGLADFLGSMDANGDGTSSRIGSSGNRAGGDFSRINLQYQRLQKVRQQVLLTRVYIQESSDLLTPIEQFSLGGPHNVRGYLNSDFIVDSARGITLEYIGYSHAEKLTLPISEVKLAAFLDYASGNRNDPLPNERSSVTLTAIGGYAEFTYNKKIKTRLDLGIPLSSAEPSNENSIQLFFHFTYPF